MIIEEGKSLRLENVLSLRKKMTQADINSEMIKIGKLFEGKGIRKAGPIVTATYSVEMLDGQMYMDMEILVPMDHTTELPDDYRLKPIFNLVNAVYARHQGNPASIQGTYDNILNYIREKSLQQITAGYNVQVNDLMPGQSPDDMVIDVYIGVNPSIL